MLASKKAKMKILRFLVLYFCELIQNLHDQESFFTFCIFQPTLAIAPTSYIPLLLFLAPPLSVVKYIFLFCLSFLLHFQHCITRMTGYSKICKFCLLSTFLNKFKSPGQNANVLFMFNRLNLDNKFCFYWHERSAFWSVDVRTLKLQ